jgi:hypothetical protein
MMSDEQQVGLKLVEWPAVDQRIWADARKPAGFLESPKPASQWSRQWRMIVEQAYGQWLSWLLRRGLLIPDLHPCERVTPELFMQFVSELRARVAPQSRSMMLGGLQRMLRVLAPHMNWDWLRRLYAHAQATAKPQRPRTAYATGAAVRVGPPIDEQPMPIAARKQGSTFDPIQGRADDRSPYQLPRPHFESRAHRDRSAPLFEEDHYWLSFPEGRQRVVSPSWVICPPASPLD